MLCLSRCLCALPHPLALMPQAPALLRVTPHSAPQETTADQVWARRQHRPQKGIEEVGEAATDMVRVPVCATGPLVLRRE